MKRYEKYKASGVQWIGNIPEEWAMSQIKYATYVKGRIGWKGLKSDEFLDEGYAYLVTGTDFEKGKINWENCYSIDKERYDEDPFIQIKKDDLLITKDGTIGKVAHIDSLPKYTCLNSGIFVVRPLLKELQSRYLYYILISNVFSDFFDFNSTGATILHLYQNVFDRFGFPIPAIQEQNKIISFLDHKTAQIDALIEKKEQLIEKLKLQRQAIINEAVTKGLNPNVPMKDSGIEWLGEIPTHWKVVKLKHLFKITGGGTPNKQVDDFWNGTIPWVSPKDMKVDLITTTEDFITDEGLANSATNLIDEGNLLMVVRSGILQRTIPIAITGTPVAVNQDIKAFTSRGRVSSNYLFYFVKGNELNLLNEIVKQGATVESVELDFLTNTFIVFPSITEQNQIVDYLDKKEQNAEQVTNKLSQSIEKLTLYRQSLISEAVTGKIDVRDWETTKTN
ncbi:restriction endonuclease subunit S [Maribellus sp. YY47]|uniref:restriction endonuclease subunit S n=1 Tax=Maribellus sp. YY47 TaxID=2929486 RepID=UPI002001180E|nr:restriction endonuclease subunit S [Maribellus sp. YY47]MCK3686171.1 restriction endonuclease subunit S [Maribellus sp. YY47]